MRNIYQAYGIPIISKVELKALAIADSYSTSKPIYIEVGNTPRTLQASPLYKSDWIEYNEYEFKYEHTRIARYYVKDGEQIIIEPLSEKWNETLSFFYTNCLAAALLQRNLLPFHVSGVFVEADKVLLFAAPSRVGKSTTALMLQQNGYDLFTDDTALLSIENAICYAQASYPVMRYWQNTLDQQTMLSEIDKVPIAANVDKYAFQFHGNFKSHKVEVAGIVFLEEAGNETQIWPLKPLQTMQLLGYNAYRREWLMGMKKYELLFKQLKEVALTLPAWKAVRPLNKPSFEEFSNQIHKEIIMPISHSELFGKRKKDVDIHL